MSSAISGNGSHKLIIFGILRHYWHLKIPLAMTIDRIRQTEGNEAISMKEARKWFDQFEKGNFGLEEAQIDKSLIGQQFGERMNHSLHCVLLPNELWVEVFSFLQPSQFLRLEFVCANWRSIVNTFFWPKLHRLNTYILEEIEFRALSIRFGSQIRSLLFGKTLNRINLPIREIIRHMPMLEKIRIGNGTRARDIDAIPELVPNLLHADLDLTNDNYEGLPSILHGCRRLNVLELSFACAIQKESTATRRAFELRLSVNRVPNCLKMLRASECGLFLPHLLELAVRDCGQHLQVLTTGPFLRTEFETAEVAESLILLRNLRFLQIDIDASMLKMCIIHHPEAFRSLRGLSCGFFDVELISLLRRNCPDLEHLSLGQLPRGVGRSTYRSLGHFVKKMPKLRALDVREVAEFSHKWRLNCGLQLAQYGHEKLEFLNLMIDVPFELFILIVKNFKCLKCLNCFTIFEFSLGPMLKEAFSHRLTQIGSSGKQIPVLKIGIVNKTEFERKFEKFEQNTLFPAIKFQKYSVGNHVEAELMKIEYDEEET